MHILPLSRSRVASSLAGQLVSNAGHRPLTPLQLRYASQHAKSQAELRPHSKLSLKLLLRSLLVAAMCSHRFVLSPAVGVLRFLDGSRRFWIFDVQRNPVLHSLMKKTLYNHFCAGENRAEVTSTIAEIKRMGFRGAILTYAREIVVDNRTEEETSRGTSKKDQSSGDHSDSGIEAWRDGVLTTVEMLGEGDILALKSAYFSKVQV